MLALFIIAAVAEYWNYWPLAIVMLVIYLVWGSKRNKKQTKGIDFGDSYQKAGIGYGQDRSRQACRKRDPDDPDDNDGVKTDDERDILAWLTLMTFSLLSLTATAFAQRRHDRG